jgi:hypothetical protein
MDLDSDGLLTRNKIEASVSKHYGNAVVGDLVADNVMFIADIHNTDGI